MIFFVKIRGDMKLLAATRNRYNGMAIHSDDLPDAMDVFNERLLCSIAQWKSEGVHAVWLFLSSMQTHLIQTAMNCGFVYHHCTAAEVMMVQRLVPNAEIPSFATHTMGVGAVIFSERKEILTIVERGDCISRPNHFKFPGGMLERGEHIADGVVREVFEETGIKAEFEGLISFRHHHGGQFGSSNIYAVCQLKPLTFDIVIDEVEIGKALWMPVNEFIENSGVGLYNKHIVEMALTSGGLKSVQIDGYMNSPDEYEIYSPRRA